MKRSISLLFVAMILAGVICSTLHVHGALTPADNRMEIVENHNFCGICAYHFQFSVSTPQSTEYAGLETSFISPKADTVFEKPLLNLIKNRAPPVLT